MTTTTSTTASAETRKRRRETLLREIKEHARGALFEYDSNENIIAKEAKKKKKKNVFGGENGGDVKKEKRWTNSEWRDAFDRLFLDDAETFKEVGMQDDLLFYAPSSGRSASSSSSLYVSWGENNKSGAKGDVVFVRRWKKKDRNIESSDVATATAADNNNLEELTTENVDWRATTLLNIVQHTTYSAEVSVCLLDQLEKRQQKSGKKGGEDKEGTLANPLASCKTKVFASTSKMAQSNNLKSDRRESTLPEVAFESYYANSEEWEKCALTKDGDCLCVRLFATGGVLKMHDGDNNSKTTEEEKIVVFSGFAPRSDVARAYNVERKAAYKQAFTFRAFANSTFGFDLPKFHNNSDINRRRKYGGSNSTSSNGIAGNGLYDNGYRVNGAHGNHEDYDDDDDDDDDTGEADHLDGDIPDSSNHNDNNIDDDDGDNHGGIGGGGGGTSFLSPYRHHPKSFASPSRGGAGETDAVVTLGRGTEKEGEAAVAVSAEHLHFSPSSTQIGGGGDDFSASGGSGVNSDADNSSAYDTDETSSSRHAASGKNTTKNRKGGVRRLLNFGRKVETVREVAESSSLPSPSSRRAGGGETDVTRLRCRLLSVKVHWRALARDLLYKEWR